MRDPSRSAPSWEAAARIVKTTQIPQALAGCGFINFGALEWSRISAFGSRQLLGRATSETFVKTAQ